MARFLHSLGIKYEQYEEKNKSFLKTKKDYKVKVMLLDRQVENRKKLFNEVEFVLQ